MEKNSDLSDVPDSATTLRDPIFHDIKINDDVDHVKSVEDEVDPLDGSSGLPLNRSSSSTSDEKVDKDVDAGILQRQTSQAKQIWKFRLRPVDDDEPQ